MSSAFGFLACDRTGGLDKFIPIVIIFGRRSLRDSGILRNLRDGKLLDRDNEKLPTSDLARGAVRVQEENKLGLGGNEKPNPFTLTCGEQISPHGGQNSEKYH